MTIAALRALLDEIDGQGGPQAARHNRLALPAPAPKPPAPPAVTPPVEKHTPAPAKPDTEPPDCGTRSGYRWHIAHHERPCEPCANAESAVAWFLGRGKAA